MQFHFTSYVLDVILLLLTSMSQDYCIAFAPQSKTELKSAIACLGLLPKKRLSMSAMNNMPIETKIDTSVRTFFITGATDGIGRHTALKLACDGHRVLVHGRKPPDSEEVRKLLTDIRGNGAHSTSYLQANLLDLEQVSQLAEDVRKETETLDVLISNAGVFDPSEQKSAQGFEPTWAVNVLAPFKLTMLLLPMIAKGTDPRIIVTSSMSQSDSLPSDVDSIGVAGGPYTKPHKAYGLSKLGDRLFTVGLADRLRASSDPRLSAIKCLAVDPDMTNTKLHFYGWGWCGQDLRYADNTYSIATANVDHLESGTYSFGSSGSHDPKRPANVSVLWNLLEKQTGLVYSEMAIGA